MPNLLIPKHVIKYIFKESELQEVGTNGPFESESDME